MKLVEAMKKLKVIEKRMKSNCEEITRYSSMVSTERPLFETESKQEQEVLNLVQSNNDLIIEYLKIKKQIEKTNLETIVYIDSKDYSLSDMLIIKRKLAALQINTFRSMNDNEGSSRLRQQHSSNVSGGDKTPHVIRFYKEEDRNKGLRKWEDLYNTIDSRLEVINATTDLIED